MTQCIFLRIFIWHGCPPTQKLIMDPVSWDSASPSLHHTNKICFLPFFCISPNLKVCLYRLQNDTGYWYWVKYCEMLCCEMICGVSNVRSLCERDKLGKVAPRFLSLLFSRTSENELFDEKQGEIVHIGAPSGGYCTKNVVFPRARAMHC